MESPDLSNCAMDNSYSSMTTSESEQSISSLTKSMESFAQNSDLNDHQINCVDEEEDDHDDDDDLNDEGDSTLKHSYSGSSCNTTVTSTPRGGVGPYSSVPGDRSGLRAPNFATYIFQHLSDAEDEATRRSNINNNLEDESVEGFEGIQPLDQLQGCGLERDNSCSTIKWEDNASHDLSSMFSTTVDDILGAGCDQNDDNGNLAVTYNSDMEVGMTRLNGHLNLQDMDGGSHCTEAGGGDGDEILHRKLSTSEAMTSSYLRMTYTQEEIHHLAEQAEMLVLGRQRSSKDNAGGSSYNGSGEEDEDLEEVGGSSASSLSSESSPEEGTASLGSGYEGHHGETEVSGGGAIRRRNSEIRRSRRRRRIASTVGEEERREGEEREDLTASPNKRSSQKFRRKFRRLDFQQNPTSMEISSPDSVKSIDHSKSLSEDSCTVGASALPEPSEGPLAPSGSGSCFSRLPLTHDSLDEVSSGEMGHGGEHSNHVSDFWDQESLLSEYQYDEMIDEDKAKRLLNFGDDYRNFISSLSSSESSIYLERRKGRNIRRKKNRSAGGANVDSCTDSEMSAICSCIEESSAELNHVETKTKELEEESGFIQQQNIQPYSELMSVCSSNLRQLVDLLQSFDLQEAFVSRKKSREIRMLVNRWNKLRERIHGNLEQAELYHTLNQEITQFRTDLTRIIESTEPSEPSTYTSLETKLNTFKEAMVELTSFKGSLFKLNLSVHNLLAGVSTSLQSSKKVEGVRGLQEEVVHLYSLWDTAHHQIAGGLANTQDALRKLSDFEDELLELRNTLRQDAECLKEATQAGLNGGGGKPGKIVKQRSSRSSGDSGISDGYGFEPDHDGNDTDGTGVNADCCEAGGRGSTVSLTASLSGARLPLLREETLNRLKLVAKNLERALPPNSEALQLITSALKTTSDELRDLKRVYRLARLQQAKSAKLAKKKTLTFAATNGNSIDTEAKGMLSSSTGKPLTKIAEEELKTDSNQSVKVGFHWMRRRRGRLMRLSLLAHCLLVLVMFLAWLAQPTCCDNLNNFSFGPHLSYVNGPPPI